MRMPPEVANALRFALGVVCVAAAAAQGVTSPDLPPDPLSSARQRSSPLDDLLRGSNAVVWAAAIGWSVVDTETLEVTLRVEGKPVRGAVDAAVLPVRLRVAHAGRIGPFREAPAGLWFLARQENSWVAQPVTPRKLASVSDFVLPVAEQEFRFDGAEPGLHEIAARSIKRVSLPQDAWDRRHLVRGLDSPAIRAGFAGWRDATHPSLSAIGASELLHRGDVETIRLIQHQPERLAGLAGEGRNMVLSAITQTFRTDESGAIAALNGLAMDESRNADLRVAAAHALAMIHTPHTLRTLAALLDDPMVELRQEGCIGLGMFANGMPMQLRQHSNSQRHLNSQHESAYRSPDVSKYFGFDPKREDEFVNFWKDWWQQHQSDFP